MLNGIGATLYHAQNPIAKLLGAADLRLEHLTHSVIPVAGAVTPSMTRSTTATCVDSWGRQITALAGEVRFPGARRVDNLIRLGAAQSSTLAVAANVTMTLAAGTYIFSMGVSTGRATFSGTGGATGTLDASSSARVEVAKTITAGTLIITASVATLTDLQVEYVSGQSVQQAAAYVSVGVESAPAYHGSMVDGVKCFPTDLSGNPLTTMTTPLIELAATNVCLQSNAYNTAPWSNAFGTVAFTQNAVGPDGAISAWTGVDSDAAVASYGAQSMTLTTANWTQSILVGKTTGAQASYPCFGAYRGSTDIALCTVDTSNGIATVWTAYTGLTVATSSARCTSYNANFWLVELTLLGTAAVWSQCLMKIPAGTTNPTQSTGVMQANLQGSAVFYGGQMELGTKATSYIATGATAVTRNADQFYYSGALIGQLKTLAVRGFRRDVGVSNVGVIAELNDGTANEDTYGLFSSATNLGYIGRDGGSTVLQSASVSAATNTYTPGTSRNFAISTGALAADKRLSEQGATITPSIANANVGTATRLGIGMYNDGSFQLNGYPGKIYGWTRNLSQSELNGVSA